MLASSLLAQKELSRAVKAVADGLNLSLASGRAAVSHIVGRDPDQLDEAGVARASIESLAESTSDGVVAPLFWLFVGGLPGALIYKAVNTADSMVGHKTDRHLEFGWASARFDDLLNLIPARLTALLVAGASFFVRGADPERSWKTSLQDASKHDSPNAGWPEAAYAGALGFRLGGARSYDGIIHETPGFRRWPVDLDGLRHPQIPRALLGVLEPAACRHDRHRTAPLALRLAFGPGLGGRGLRKSLALEGHRQAGDDEMDVGADFGEPLMGRARKVAEHPRHGIIGHDPQPTSLETRITLVPAILASAAVSPSTAPGHILVRDQQIGDPERQAVDEDDVVLGCSRFDSCCKRQRLFERLEALVALLLVHLDPLPHLVVERLRGREVERSVAGAHGQLLGKTGLAGASPAQNAEHVHPCSSSASTRVQRAGSGDWSHRGMRQARMTGLNEVLILLSY